MENNKIGKFIYERRKEKNLTQQELGEKLYVTDKAVSKWERGLSLPDISILEKLAEVLDTDLYGLLQLEKKKTLDIEKIINDEINKTKKANRKKLIIILCPFFLITLLILFNLYSFGYEVRHIRHTYIINKLINLGVPKYSFGIKNNGNNYTYKNFRNKSILKNEVSNYLNSLEHLSCNNTIYYYDNDADITIINYFVKGNIIYNTISYDIRNGDYCNALLLEEYEEKLGGLNRFHVYNSEDAVLKIQFYHYENEDNRELSFKARLNILYFDFEKKKYITIEDSNGNFEIQNSELIYYRTEVTESDKNTSIPNVSRFIIKKQKLIPKDDYLSKFKKEIILE